MTRTQTYALTGLLSALALTSCGLHHGHLNSEKEESKLSTTPNRTQFKQPPQATNSTSHDVTPDHSFSTTGASGVGQGERVIGGASPSHTSGTEPGTLGGSGGETIGYNHEDTAPQGLQSRTLQNQVKNGVELQELRRRGVLEGYKVLNVPKRSPLAVLGLKANDVITIVNERPVQETDVTVAQLQSGRAIESLQVWRDGESLTLSDDSVSASSRGHD